MTAAQSILSVAQLQGLGMTHLRQERGGCNRIPPRSPSNPSLNSTEASPEREIRISPGRPARHSLLLGAQRHTIGPMEASGPA